MSVTFWLLSIAAVLYLVGRRRSRRHLVVIARLIGVLAVCFVVGQVVWFSLRQ